MTELVGTRVQPFLFSIISTDAGTYLDAVFYANAINKKVFLITTERGHNAWRSDLPSNCVHIDIDIDRVRL